MTQCQGLRRLLQEISLCQRQFLTRGNLGTRRTKLSSPKSPPVTPECTDTFCPSLNHMPIFLSNNLWGVRAGFTSRDGKWKRHCCHGKMERQPHLLPQWDLLFHRKSERRTDRSWSLPSLWKEWSLCQSSWTHYMKNEEHKDLYADTNKEETRGMILFTVTGCSFQ